MAYWLLKTEPADYSIDDLQRADGPATWDGIRNYQARNFLRDELAPGDEALVYHSGIPEPAIVGSARVLGRGYPDPAQFDPGSRYHDPRAHPDRPRWYCIDIRFSARFSRPLPLATIRQLPGLDQMSLLRQGRLSVSPVTAPEWALINHYCKP